MWPLLISCLCRQPGKTLMALVNKKPWSGSSQYPSPCADHIPKNSHSASLRGHWARAMTAHYPYSIWAVLCPCLFPHCRCKRADTLSHMPNTSTSIPVPANSHSDGQRTLPLLINKLITLWVEHKIRLWLWCANWKQTAASATLTYMVFWDLLLQRVTFIFQNALCLCSHHPPFYWLVCVNVYPCQLTSFSLYLRLLNFAKINYTSRIQ